jgi:hypothetical protein
MKTGFGGMRGRRSKGDNIQRYKENVPSVKDAFLKNH